MANQDDARRIATSLPEVTEEDGRFAFRVRGKESPIGMDPEAFFTEPHYDGFAAVLVRLAAIDVGLLEEPIVRAWRIQAPKRLAATLDR